MKKIKIAILTTFRKFDPGYALAVGWLERAKMLKYFDQDFTMFVQSNCKDTCYPNMKAVLPHPDKDVPFEIKVSQFEKAFLKYLPDYDVILTADFIYQKKGNFLPANQAMRNVQPKLKAKWYHWIHSGWTKRYRCQYPEKLRITMMDNSTLVYMNKSETAGVAQMYATTEDNVACVYNPKDYRSFNEFSEDAWDITKILDIPNKDIIQIFPHCSTRAGAKGFHTVIETFAALKRNGAKVALILANSHAKSVRSHILSLKTEMRNMGLIEKEDFIFTSDLMNQKYKSYLPLPRRAVADLFKVSNVFVFASWREVCPNVVLEAKINSNLIVMSESLACGREFGGKGYSKNLKEEGYKNEGAIYFECSAKVPGVADGSRGDMNVVKIKSKYYDALAKEIIRRAPSRKHLWEYSFETIWNTQMKPLLYGGENEN